MGSITLRLDRGRLQALAAELPHDTVSYLVEVGVPDHVEFRGLDFAFDLALEPTHQGTLYRVADVGGGFLTAALRRTTGHFVVGDPGPGTAWTFVNSSLRQFITCVEASERLWERERTGQVAWAERGSTLEAELGRLDPSALEHAESPWAVLVEELRAGVA